MSSVLCTMRLTGSSPRMRGARNLSCILLQQDGIIPAYAGSTNGFTVNTDVDGDHPRVCGEHSIPFLRLYNEKGSSPRMRGALNLINSALPVAGIIPAYAGSTDLIDLGLGSVLGSSPRMRGARDGEGPNHSRRGIIPAYAGSTERLWTQLNMLGDHPRVCGEHGLAGELVLAEQGSSPRMRGAPNLPK